MPSAKSLENLKKGKKTQFKSGDEAAKISGAKGGKANGKTHSMRKLAQQMLAATPDVPESTLRSLRQLGLDADTPDLQTLILARIGALAIGKDAKLALQATQMFLEISGNDMRTLIAKEDRKIQRERLKMEREQMEKESQPESEGAKIIFGADGGIEVDDGL